MYNPERKQQYLLEVEQGNLATITAYFKACEPIEEALDKDISCFNAKEIVGYYKSLSTASRLYLSTINSQLSLYTSWCQNNDFLPDRQNHFNEITLDMLEECVNSALITQQYITRERLLQIINENQFVNVSTNFLILAIFEGIGGKNYSEITNLYPEDFSGDEIVLSEYRHFPISKELKKLAIASANEYIFYQVINSITVNISYAIVNLNYSNRVLATNMGHENDDCSNIYIDYDEIDNVYMKFLIFHLLNIV